MTIPFEDQAITFACGGSTLVGILSQSASTRSRGVLIVVGGPQYRIGSHRQFVLMARSLAAEGIPVLRFDYRGMGDSEGETRNFESVEKDVRAAVDVFCSRAGVTEIVIWGLCDAASAALFYAYKDERVRGLVLVNPWMRTQEGLARATIKYYYWRRLAEPEFWRKVRHRKFAWIVAARAFTGDLMRALKPIHGGGSDPGGDATALVGTLPQRMAEGLRRFPGKVLLILSGEDLTAAEFRNTARQTPEWQGLLDAERLIIRELDQANHTFSRAEWRDQVAHWTADWVRAW